MGAGLQDSWLWLSGYLNDASISRLRMALMRDW